MAAIPLKEKVKLQSLVNRIQEGNFDANDIDSLLIKVRQYTPFGKILREIADFVAHADARDKGIACNALTAYSDSMRFFTEYVSSEVRLNITGPFPPYIFRLMKSQVSRVDVAELKARFRISPQTLTKKIDTNFVLNKEKKECVARDGKVGAELRAVLEYLMSTIYVRAAFELEAVGGELQKMLIAQAIEFDKQKLDAQADRISLTLLCLLSGTEFVLADGDKANCKLGTTESQFRILKGERQLPSGDWTAEPTNLGALNIWGEVDAGRSHPNVRMVFPLVSTGLDPHTHCHPSLFEVLSEENERGKLIIESTSFAQQLALTKDFKLKRALDPH